MSIRIGLNGFGRMGRLALRAGWGRPGLEFVHVNEVKGGPETAAHLLMFDSVHGRVFEVERGTPREEVNQLLEAAAAGPLKGILGYETRPLVSVDFKDDTRSAIVDALSTMVMNGTCVKIFAWYDNEIGYVHRMLELAELAGGAR